MRYKLCKMADHEPVWSLSSGGAKKPYIRWESRDSMARGTFDGFIGLLISIGLLHVEHMDDLCKYGLTDQVIIQQTNLCVPKQPCIRSGFRSPMSRQPFKVSSTAMLITVLPERDVEESLGDIRLTMSDSG